MPRAIGAAGEAISRWSAARLGLAARRSNVALSVAITDRYRRGLRQAQARVTKRSSRIRPRAGGYRMILSLLGLAALSAAASAAPVFEPRPCAQPAAPRAQCGIVKVPENRAAPGGRMIALSVIVLKS